MSKKLKIASCQFEGLNNFLFLDDHQERVAIGLCTKADNTFFLHEVFHVPEELVIGREEWNISWDLDAIKPFVSKIRRKKSDSWVFIKFHNHPNGYSKFSEADDESDNLLVETLSNWLEVGTTILSCVLVPNRKMFGRQITSKNEFEPISIQIIGGQTLIEEATNGFQNSSRFKDIDFDLRNRQVLGSATHDFLSQLKIGVVGYSGLGSPLLEQLLRLGCQNLVVIDPDNIEAKNLNRIINSSFSDAKTGKNKAFLFKEIAEKINPECRVEAFSLDIAEPEVILALGSCDLFFGCMDSVDGRYILNAISTAFIIPFFDLGVGCDASLNGGISSISYRVDLISPGLSSLLTREVFSSEDLRGALGWRSDPLFENKQKDGYISNPTDSGAPAILPINMYIASKAILYFLDRLHSFIDFNFRGKNFIPDRIEGDLASVRFETRLGHESEFPIDPILAKNLGLSNEMAFSKYQITNRV